MTTRTDLPFLRRRARPASTASDAASNQASAAVAGFLRRRSRRPGRMPQPESQPAPPLSRADPGGPASPAARPGPTAPAGNLLDLGAPATPPPAGNLLDFGAPATPPPAPAGDPLDLGSSGPPEPSPPAVSPLDLSAPASPADGPVQASPSGRHHRLVSHDLGLRTITAGERRRLDPDGPVVHLTRAQSAFGALEVQPAIPQGAHLTLGAAYEIGGREGIVQPGLAPMGPDPRWPALRATPNGVVVNLRRIRAVDRILVYAVLPQQDRRMPGGTVVVRTYGGARLEVPLAERPTYGAQALLTAYVVEGRIVLRAEHDPFSGTLHQVCDAYGFSELTWRDPFTPLV